MLFFKTFFPKFRKIAQIPLLIAKVGFDIESEMRLTLAESVEAERLTGSGKWAEHAPHANLTVVRPLLARAPLTAKLISRAT